jgi:cytochrome P450 family 110
MDAASQKADALEGAHLELPPGPRLPTLAQTALFGRDPYAFLERCTRRYGSPVTVRLVENIPMILFSDPAATKEIYTSAPEEAPAGEAIVGVLGPLMGARSVMVLDGPRHLRERRLLLPQFHGQRMPLYAETMREMTDRQMRRWPVGAAFPIHHEMQAITLEVILRTVFGFSDGPKLDRLRNCLLRGLEVVDSPTAALLAFPPFRVDLGPWWPWSRLLRDKRELRTILFEEIAERRAQGTAGRTDVLSMLLEARDEDGQGMTDDDLYDEMFTLLIAGHETTATSLAWIFYRVLQHPDVVARLRQEIVEVTGGAPVAPEHLPSLHYLEAAINEAMRLHPVSMYGIRRLLRPKRVGGWVLPAGVNLAPCEYLAHRRPDVWPEPERFNPDRFLGTKINPYAFFPFGGGVRKCIGAAFANFEMKIVVAHVVARADLRIASDYRMRPMMRAVTVAPSRGVPVVMSQPPADFMSRSTSFA